MENNLPESWVETTLSEIADWGSGGTPKSTEPKYYNGNIPWLIIGDLNDGDVTSAQKSITQLGLENSSAKIVPVGSILCAMYGSIGKLGITKIPCATNQAIAFTQKIHGGIPNKYLFYYLFSIKKYLLDIGKGGTQQNISQTVLKEVPFPLAPLPEQHRIVAKLDELMEKTERSKKRLEKIPLILKRFRQSVLAVAVSGKLTEEWREKNKDVEKIDLNKLNKEREKLQKENAKSRGQKSFTYKEPVEIEIGGRTKGVDELFDIPESWNWVSLDRTVWSVSDGPHYSPKYIDKKSGIAFISGRNISYSKIDFSDAKYVSKEDHLEFIKRGKPIVGDILLTKGGTTGIAHLINISKEFSIWVHVALLKIIQNFVSPEYLRDVLTSDFLYKQSQAQTHGVGNQDLGLTRMIFMTIPLPPLKEQLEIVRRVETLFAFADKIETRYTKAKAQFDKLPQALLAKAFRGELVEQDERDESAEKLLEGIKKEKNSKAIKRNLSKSNPENVY